MNGKEALSLLSLLPLMVIGAASLALNQVFLLHRIVLVISVRLSSIQIRKISKNLIFFGYGFFFKFGKIRYYIFKKVSSHVSYWCWIESDFDSKDFEEFNVVWVMAFFSKFGKVSIISL